MSPILVAGLTIATRFIFAGCCARAAIGHVAAVPPKSVMNSRRCMHPPEGKTHRRLKPNTLRRGGGEKGQPIDPRRCDPMSVRGVRRGKAALSSGCKSHPATAPAGSSRSSQGGNELVKPSECVSRIGDSASVQAVTRVNAEQALYGVFVVKRFRSGDLSCFLDRFHCSTWN